MDPDSWRANTLQLEQKSYTGQALGLVRARLLSARRSRRAWAQNEERRLRLIEIKMGGESRSTRPTCDECCRGHIVPPALELPMQRSDRAPETLEAIHLRSKYRGQTLSCDTDKIVPHAYSCSTLNDRPCRKASRKIRGPSAARRVVDRGGRGLWLGVVALSGLSLKMPAREDPTCCMSGETLSIILV